MPPLTVEQQACVVEGYVNNVIDNMGIKEMESLLFDLLTESLQDRTEAEVKELITAIYGEEFYQDLVTEATA